MTFDSVSTIDVGPLEPALLLALTIACVVAWFSGKALGGLTARVAKPWLGKLYFGATWVALAFAFVLVIHFLLGAIYPLLQASDRGAVVSAGAVWPMLFLPALVSLIAGLPLLRRGRGILVGAS
jgi:hypothetical protein